MNKINHDAGIRLHSGYWQAIVMVSTFFTSRTREIPHQANKQPEHILQRGQFWHLGYKSTHYFLIKKEKKPCKQLGLQFIKHLLFFFSPGILLTLWCMESLSLDAKLATVLNVKFA